ncbi:MAG: DUF433 domain-containing protein [Chloroflexi bacterium]|nr:DUF433 domain-containing protein [Chloroflexota bacterium]
MAATEGLVEIGSIIQRREGYRGGRPFIAGTGITVDRIAVLTLQGSSPEEIVDDYHPALSLGQVYAALAFYLLNKDRIDAEIVAMDEETERDAEEYRRTGKLPV